MFLIGPTILDVTPILVTDAASNWKIGGVMPPGCPPLFTFVFGVFYLDFTVTLPNGNPAVALSTPATLTCL